MNSLPNRPMLLPEVTGLPEGSEKIRRTSPLTTIELNEVPAVVISFVMVTRSPGYFAFVFEKENDAWTTIYESEDDEGLQPASDAIFDYWDERSAMSDPVEIETREAVFDEHSVTDLDLDAYLDYFAPS